MLGKKMQNQFMTSRQASFSRPGGAYSNIASGADSGYDQDSDTSTREPYSSTIEEQLRSQSAFDTYQNGTTDYDTDSSAHESFSVPSIRRTEYPTASYAYDSEDSQAGLKTRMMSADTHNMRSIAPPDPAVLEDNVEVETMVHELDRLFGDLENGLAYAADVLQQREKQMNAEMEADTGVYTNGAISEGENYRDGFA